MKLKESPDILPKPKADSTKDPFSWLRDASWQNAADGIKSRKIKAYVAREKTYSDSFFTEKEETVEAYCDLRVSMIPAVRDSPPLPRGQYYYFTRVQPHLDYPSYYRYRQNETPYCFFDANKEAKGYPFYELGSISISPDGTRIAYSVDTIGNERYEIRILDHDISLTDTDGTIIWDQNSTGIYYILRDEKDRNYEIYHVNIETKIKTHIFTEHDPKSYLSMGKSNDSLIVFICCEQKESSEVHYIDLRKDSFHVECLLPRRNKREADFDHGEGGFYGIINDSHPNGRLVKILDDARQEADWIELIPGDDENSYKQILTLKNTLICLSYKDGTPKLKLMKTDRTKIHEIPFPNQAYELSINETEYHHHRCYVSYSDLSTPSQTYAIDLETLTMEMIHEATVASPIDLTQYVTKREWIAARDGTNIPVSLVYHKNTPKHHLILYGYGAYGHAVAPYFRESILPFLDAGFVYAIAHIRGGDDLGKKWYWEGKFNKKWNTFYDFIDVAEGLTALGYAKVGNIAAMGGSAGGLLMGVVANARPDLFYAIVMLVPFVDVMNTMMDITLPLTPGEFEEWGNPITDQGAYTYMLSYSPYDNIRHDIKYPALMVTGGEFDFRVTYWEPLKYVAKMRLLSPQTFVVLRFNTTGHAGGSTLKDSFREMGEVYAFLCAMRTGTPK